MPKVYKANEIIKLLKKYEFEKVSQRWSHVKYKNNTWNIVIIPIHAKDIPYGTYVSILKQANITKEIATEFLGK